MTGDTLHKRLCRTTALMAVLAVVSAATGLRAERRIGGRFFLTYQDSDTPTVSREGLLQHYELTLSDRVLHDSDLRVSLYFDNNDNRTDDLTIRRYQGRLDLSNRYYQFNARFSPRQRITPLELEQSRELTENQVVLDVHVPDVPQFRLWYQTRRQYADGEFTGYARDLRGDVRYRINIFEFNVNRWQTKSENSSESSRSVTGAGVKVNKIINPSLSASSGYDFQLTETDPGIGPGQNNQNHTFNGLVSGRFRRVVSSSFSLTSRYFKTDNNITASARDDIIAFLARFLPQYPLNIDVNWNHQASRRDTARTVADYATLQALLTGTIRQGSTGRLQVARRFEIEEKNGVIPSHLYAASVQSRVIEGIDLRANLSVSERPSGAEILENRRFQTLSSVDVYLKPLANLQLTPQAQLIKYSRNLGFTRYDQRLFTLRAVYYPAAGINLGTNLRRHVLTTGEMRVENGAAFNLSVRFRTRTSVNVTYSRNEIDIINEPVNGETNPDTKRDAVNVLAQTWVTKQGSLSLNYTRTEPEGAPVTSYLTVTFRQEF